MSRTPCKNNEIYYSVKSNKIGHNVDEMYAHFYNI